MNTTEFTKKCEEICSFLGSEWTFKINKETSEWWFSACLSNGIITIKMRTDDGKFKDKLKFLGVYPSTKKGFNIQMDRKDSMFCSFSKDSKQISKDIFKKIYPNIVMNTEKAKNVVQIFNYPCNNEHGMLEWIAAQYPSVFIHSFMAVKYCC